MAWIVQTAVLWGHWGAKVWGHDRLASGEAQGKRLVCELAGRVRALSPGWVS